MGLSFTRKLAEPASSSGKLRVLITGAAGRIGSYLAEATHSEFELRLLVHHRRGSRRLAKFGEIVEAELSDRRALERACREMDVVIHLAGNPDAAAEWDSLLAANIIGTHHLFRAAQAAGCRKIIYASSIHAVSGYPADLQVKTTDPVNPGDLYGVSKCFGEALGRYLAEQEGLPVIVIRIGAFQPIQKARKRASTAMMDAFVSPRDLAELIRRCVRDESLQFAIFHGLSNNRFKRLDLTDSRELLGWMPQDDLTEENPELKPLRLAKRVRAHSKADTPRNAGK